MVLDEEGREGGRTIVVNGLKREQIYGKMKVNLSIVTVQSFNKVTQLVYYLVYDDDDHHQQRTDTEPGAIPSFNGCCCYFGRWSWFSVCLFGIGREELF